LGVHAKGVYTATAVGEPDDWTDRISQSKKEAARLGGLPHSKEVVFTIKYNISIDMKGQE
jgi:hypothetical protein